MWYTVIHVAVKRNHIYDQTRQPTRRIDITPTRSAIAKLGKDAVFVAAERYAGDLHHESAIAAVPPYAPPPTWPLATHVKYSEADWIYCSGKATLSPTGVPALAQKDLPYSIAYAAEGADVQNLAKHGPMNVWYA